jgi:hypothetical protein
MSTLTGQSISSSYLGLIHLSTNTQIANNTYTQLQDGSGNNLGVYVNTNGTIAATNFSGSLIGTASNASFAVLARTASYLDGNAQSASYAGYAAIAGLVITASYAISASFLQGTASYANTSLSSSYASNAQQATSASFANSSSYALSASFALNAAGVPGLVPTASFNPYSASINNFTASINSYTSSLKTAFTASSTSVTFNGANYNKIITLSVTSQTASMDLSQSNLYSLTLLSGFNTYINPSNIGTGQVISLLITQPTGGIGSTTFAPSVTFPSGSYYTASAFNATTDLVTMISFNTSSLRAVASNNFI